MMKSQIERELNECTKFFTNKEDKLHLQINEKLKGEFLIEKYLQFSSFSNDEYFPSESLSISTLNLVISLMSQEYSIECYIKLRVCKTLCNISDRIFFTRFSDNKIPQRIYLRNFIDEQNKRCVLLGSLPYIMECLRMNKLEEINAFLDCNPNQNVLQICNGDLFVGKRPIAKIGFTRFRHVVDDEGYTTFVDDRSQLCDLREIHVESLTRGIGVNDTSELEDISNMPELEEVYTSEEEIDVRDDDIMDLITEEIDVEGDDIMDSTTEEIDVEDEISVEDDDIMGLVTDEEIDQEIDVGDDELDDVHQQLVHIIGGNYQEEDALLTNVSQIKKQLKKIKSLIKCLFGSRKNNYMKKFDEKKFYGYNRILNGQCWMTPERQQTIIRLLEYIPHLLDQIKVNNFDQETFLRVYREICNGNDYIQLEFIVGIDNNEMLLLMSYTIQCIISHSMKKGCEMVFEYFTNKYQLMKNIQFKEKVKRFIDRMLEARYFDYNMDRFLRYCFDNKISNIITSKRTSGENLQDSKKLPLDEFSNHSRYAREIKSMFDISKVYHKKIILFHEYRLCDLESMDLLDTKGYFNNSMNIFSLPDPEQLEYKKECIKTLIACNFGRKILQLYGKIFGYRDNFSSPIHAGSSEYKMLRLRENGQGVHFDDSSDIKLQLEEYKSNVINKYNTLLLYIKSVDYDLYQQMSEYISREMNLPVKLKCFIDYIEDLDYESVTTYSHIIIKYTNERFYTSILVSILTSLHKKLEKYDAINMKEYPLIPIDTSDLKNKRKDSIEKDVSLERDIPKERVIGLDMFLQTSKEVQNGKKRQNNKKGRKRKGKGKGKEQFNLYNPEIHELFIRACKILLIFLENSNIIEKHVDFEKFFEKISELKFLNIFEWLHFILGKSFYKYVNSNREIIFINVLKNEDYSFFEYLVVKLKMNISSIIKQQITHSTKNIIELAVMQNLL